MLGRSWKHHTYLLRHKRHRSKMETPYRLLMHAIVTHRESRRTTTLVRGEGVGGWRPFYTLARSEDTGSRFE